MTLEEQNIYESYNEDGTFDWDTYQYWCDIYSYWDDEED